MTKLKEWVEETLKWMETEHLAEEYEEKQQELNKVFNPMRYMTPESGMPPMQEPPKETEQGPKIEEVD